MSRPGKKGLDYFTVDCNFNNEVELAVAEFGMKGLGVLIRLWQKIYGGEGYYCVWNTDVALLFSHRETGLGVNAVSEIIRACLRRGLFDCGLYETCGILTSKGIQERYFNAIGRREKIEVIDEYLLVPAPKNAVSANNHSVSAYRNDGNVNRNPQSRVEESRVEESRVEKSRAEESSGREAASAAPRPQKHKYGEYQNVLLTDEELDKLKGEFPDWQARIERLSEYMASKGKGYQNHLATIRAWAKKDEAERKREQSDSTYDREQFDTMTFLDEWEDAP